MSDTDFTPPALVIPRFTGNKLTRSCAACDFSAAEGKDRVCRRQPPHVQMFAAPEMVPGPKGMQQMMAIRTHAAFPVVRDDQWCGEFRGRLQ